MTPDEISDDAASRYVKAVGGEGLYMADTHEERMAIAKIEVAAAVNAVFGDETPVTPSLLRSAGYFTSNNDWLHSPDVSDPNAKSIVFTVDQYVDNKLSKCDLCSKQYWESGMTQMEIDIKTLGQLRAWHLAIGQPLKETAA